MVIFPAWKCTSKIKSATEMLNLTRGYAGQGRTASQNINCSES